MSYDDYRSVDTEPVAEVTGLLQLEIGKKALEYSGLNPGLREMFQNFINVIDPDIILSCKLFSHGETNDLVDSLVELEAETPCWEEAIQCDEMLRVLNSQ